MTEAREEETWVEEVEVWVEKASQLLPFLVGSLVAPVGIFWGFLWIPISFGTFFGGEGWLKTS